MVINDFVTINDGLVILLFCTTIRMVYRIVPKIGYMDFKGRNLARVTFHF